jgi:protein required for attachment to host cells
MAVWVVVADAGRARYFQTESLKGELTEVMDKANPLARISQTGLASDEPGRNVGPAGIGTHGMQEKVTPREAEDIKFAGEIADDIRGALDGNRIGAFYLGAPPHVLGLLRKAMTNHVAKALAGDLGKDLTTRTVAEIRSHLVEIS